MEKEAYGRLARGIQTTKPLLFWLRSVSFVIRAEVADEMGYRVKGRGTTCAGKAGTYYIIEQSTVRAVTYM